MLKKFLIITCFIFISCSKRLAPDLGTKIYKKGFSTNYIEFINVYKNDTQIYIKSIYRDNYEYFVGDISNIKLKDKLDERVFANKLIELKAIDEDENPESIFNQIENSKDFQKINIIKYDDWSKIILPVLEKVILKLVPKEKNTGIAVSIANKDFAIFYNNDDMINTRRLEDVKNNIKIIKIYNEKQFYQIVATEVKKLNIVKKQTKNDLIIFELGENDEVNSPYVLFNTKTNAQYYFDFTTFFKAKQGVSNIDYYLQIIFTSIIKAHIIEPIKNPITTIQKGSTFVFQGVKKTLETKKINHLEKIPPLNNNGEMMDINNFEKYLDKIAGKRTYKGSMKYLIGGPSFFTDLINEVERSNDEIFIRLYIFSNDDYGVRLSNILKNKNDNGVDVRILTGGLASSAESLKKTGIPFDNSFKQPQSIGQYLAYDSKINFRTSADTFFMFDHSKMIIIDKKVAYVGGMNIGQPYRYSWHDMMVKLKGPIVHKIHNNFTVAWAAAGPTGDLGKFSTMIYNLNPPSEELSDYYNRDKERQIDIRILYTKPQLKTIYESQMYAIKNAKKFIYIENPYLADYKIINALIEARGRGVDVRIILPSKNNVGMMAASNLVATNIFLKNGIRVYKYQGMTHIKAAIYDGWATLGSANFDNLSLMINDEFNIAFSDPYYVEKLKKELFEQDFKLSVEIKEPYVINWYDKVMSSFANRF